MNRGTAFPTKIACELIEDSDKPVSRVFSVQPEDTLGPLLTSPIQRR